MKRYIPAEMDVTEIVCGEPTFKIPVVIILPLKSVME